MTSLRPVRLRRVDDAPRLLHSGGERLLDEDMGAGLHRPVTARSAWLSV